MKRIFALAVTGFAIAVFSAQAADSARINGWISDSSCGAKHAGSGAECVRACIKSGKAPVFVDQEKKEVWKIDNPDAVKAFYGDHVTVTATADESNKSVHIDAIEAAQ
ncbi:MAG TPA: hypothetical protein VHX20_01250 [Terracidiphilus sp.]|jgi:hypothetical protein|nr:hypothetical protein [Terracidiphilus sp.]